MDITISPHNLKRFAASITCLGKIGKDLYLSFDPLDGLTLSSLNDAKSAFGKFHFEPGFFDKCGGGVSTNNATGEGVNGGVGIGEGMQRNTKNSRPTNNPRNDNHGNDKNDEDDNDIADDENARYVCRVPVRSVHSILRPRKGVISLRIRSEGMDGDGNHFGMNRMNHQGKGDDTNKNRGRDRDGHRSRGRGSRSRSRDFDDEEDQDNNPRERRQEQRRRSRSRMRRQNNKTTNDDDDDDDHNGNNKNDDDNVNGISYNTKKMMLSFEYYIECLTSKNNDMNSNHLRHNHNKSTSTTTHGVGGGTFRVLHKVGVTDCNGISLSESVAQRRTRSEIISHPRLWLRLIDPLRRTPEMALTIDDELKVVTATSFHPMEVQSGGSSGNNNAILQAAVARNAVLKTETSMGADEFDEFDFRNNRGKKMMKKKGNRKNQHAADSDEGESEGVSGDEETNDDKEVNERDRPPLDVNQKVILVFSIKEAKAMLQYAAQASSSSTYDEYDDGIGGGVIVSFHWGGRPIIIETEGDYFTAELVLATLHHGMIASNITVSGGSG